VDPGNFWRRPDANRDEEEKDERSIPSCGGWR